MATNCAPQSGEVDQTSEFVNMEKTISFNYTWLVSSFNSDLESFESPIFSNKTNIKTEWRLKIKKEIFGLYGHLVLVSSDANKIQAYCKCEVLSSIPSKTVCFKSHLRLTIGTYLPCFNTKRIGDILDSANGYLQGNSIILTCKIIIKKISMQLSIPKCTVYENLASIYENPKFSDVMLCAAGKEFQAHKVILAARSPVFNAMFDHDMEEKKHNRVNITDIDGEVFGELLRFIYTGKVSNLKEYAGDLLPAAEKYGFEKLKVLCGKTLCTDISIESAAEVLVLTDMYGLDMCKAVAIGFIGAHVADIVKTDGWKLLTESRPNLITEVLCDVAEQLQNNTV